MSVPVKHHSKGKVGRRRSHLALKPTNIQACTECKAPVLAHRVCGFCGTFQTRSIKKAQAEKTAPKKETKVVAEEKKEEVPAEEELVQDEVVEEVADTTEAPEEDEVTTDEASDDPDTKKE